MKAGRTRVRGDRPTAYRAPRSVQFRTEIGSLPRRDRSSSAPRSVEFRAEIGSVPHRDHECAVPAAHFPKFLDGKRPGIFTCRESAPSTPASAFLRDSRVRHSVSAARTFALSGAPSVVCALQLLSRGSLGVVSDEVPRAPGARPAAAGRSAAASGSHVCANIDLEPEMDRSRRGTEPISTRNWTDLGVEVNRSRRGSEPISAKREGGGEGAQRRRGVTECTTGRTGRACAVVPGPLYPVPAKDRRSPTPVGPSPASQARQRALRSRSPRR